MIHVHTDVDHPYHKYSTCDCNLFLSEDDQSICAYLDTCQTCGADIVLASHSILCKNDSGSVVFHNELVDHVAVEDSDC